MKNNCIECKDNMTKDEHGICQCNNKYAWSVYDEECILIDEDN